MTRNLMRICCVLLLLVPSLVWGGSLDDYYLARFAPKAKSVQMLTGVAGQGDAATARADRCLTPLYRNLKRDWKDLEPATQKVLAKEVTRPSLTTPAIYVSPGGHFAIHYATSALSADTPDLTDVSGVQGVPDWVERVAEVFDNVYNVEVTGMGYRPPPMARCDVYLKDLVSQQAYGFTTDDGAPSGAATSVTTYIEIDKAFTNGIYTRGGYLPEQSLMATAAHEFHHSIQYGYNYYFDIWYAEMTSTWMEDEVYDSVNQLYSYLPSYLSYQPTATTPGSLSLDAPTDGSTEYGRWIFNRYLAENHNSRGVVLSMWERLRVLDPATQPLTETGDIQMAPVLDSVLSQSYGSTLSAEFFGFAKRVYSRDWTSHGGDVHFIPGYSATANYASYPVSSTTVSLPQYSFAFYRFTPSSNTANLTISLAKTSGIRAAVFKKESGTVTEIPADAGTGSFTVSGFGGLNSFSDEVVLLVANATGVDNHRATFSTDGTVSSVQEPSSVTGATSSGGSSKSGCFIATAAYGSYLHPKVALLRTFRDQYLLTNPPGRLFVAFYYRVSPPIADLIARHETLRGATRLMLAPLILAVEHGKVALALVLALLLGLAARHRGRNGAAAPGAASRV